MDPWLPVLEAAFGARDWGQSDLLRYWIYPVEGGTLVRRHPPSLPITRDRRLLAALHRSLAVYRLGFGQSRQDDRIEFALRQVPEERLAELAGRLRIDLAP
jgi:hypothetical protein